MNERSRDIVMVYTLDNIEETVDKSKYTLIDHDISNNM